MPANGAKTLWVARRRLRQGPRPARSRARRRAAATRRARSPPRSPRASKLAQQHAARRCRATRGSQHGDRLGQAEPRRPHAERATDLQIRWTNQGKQFPAPLGTVAARALVRRRLPRLPVDLRHRRRVHGVRRAWRSGSSRPIEDHLRALRDVSDDRSTTAPAWSCTRPSPTARSGSGTTRRRRRRHEENDFNTDETVKFPSTVALIWRWTGDDAFRDDMYDFAKRNLHYVVDRSSTPTTTAGPRARATSSAPGMGAGEARQHRLLHPRRCYDLADMARSKRDGATERVGDASSRASCSSRFEATWWYAGAPAVRRLARATRATQQSFQKHWIGQVPMEAELTSGGQATPGPGAPRPRDDGARGARGRRATAATAPATAACSTRAAAAAHDGKGELEIFSLTTSIQAVGEGNYGRLGADQQQRYTDANAETMFSEPATGGTPDEQPGAMPEIFPSRRTATRQGHPPNIDRCWTCRSMFMQAWGNYGTAWPVVHQQLGVRPDLGRGRLEVVPQVPDGQPRVAGSDDPARPVRRARGRGAHTRRDLHDARAGRLAGLASWRSAHTLPRGLDGGEGDARRQAGQRRDPRTTNRGARGHGRHRRRARTRWW